MFFAGGHFVHFAPFNAIKYIVNPLARFPGSGAKNDNINALADQLTVYYTCLILKSYHIHARTPNRTCRPCII